MSKRLVVGAKFSADGFTFEVLAMGSDRDGTQAAVRVTRDKDTAPKPEPKAIASGLVNQLITGALDPLKGARHLGYIEGLQRGAELCEAHSIASGRTLSVLLRNHAETMRKEAAR